MLLDKFIKMFDSTHDIPEDVKMYEHSQELKRLQMISELGFVWDGSSLEERNDS